jgi:hypothetical protein
MIKFFTQLKSDEARLAEKQRELEVEQAEFQRRQNLVIRRDQFLNRIDEAKAEFSRQCKKLDEVSIYSPELFAVDLLNGGKVENLAVRFFSVEHLKSNVPKIKSELEKLIVAPAKKALAAFQVEHKAILAKLPPPVKMAEPDFAAVELPKDHYESGASAKLTSQATGIVK